MATVPCGEGERGETAAVSAAVGAASATPRPRVGLGVFVSRDDGKICLGQR